MTPYFYGIFIMFISWMFITPSFKKSLIVRVKQFQGNYLKANFLCKEIQIYKLWTFHYGRVKTPRDPESLGGTTKIQIEEFYPLTHPPSSTHLCSSWNRRVHALRGIMGNQGKIAKNQSCKIQLFHKRLLLWSVMRDAWSMFYRPRCTMVDSYCKREFQAGNK